MRLKLKNGEQLRISEKEVMAYFKVLSQNMPGKTEKDHEYTQDNW
jgi:hypothetical protein